MACRAAASHPPPWENNIPLSVATADGRFRGTHRGSPLGARSFVRSLERTHVLSRDGGQEAPTQTQPVRTTFLPVVGQSAILATEWRRREKSGTVLENSRAMGKCKSQRAEDTGRGRWVMKRLRPLSRETAVCQMSKNIGTVA